MLFHFLNFLLYILPLVPSTAGATSRTLGDDDQNGISAAEPCQQPYDVDTPKSLCCDIGIGGDNIPATSCRDDVSRCGINDISCCRAGHGVFMSKIKSRRTSSSGADGTSGTSGTSGNSGNSGTDGANGVNGANGSSGNIVVNGVTVGSAGSSRGSQVSGGSEASAAAGGSRATGAGGASAAAATPTLQFNSQASPGASEKSTPPSNSASSNDQGTTTATDPYGTSGSQFVAENLTTAISTATRSETMDPSTMRSSVNPDPTSPSQDPTKPLGSPSEPSNPPTPSPDPDAPRRPVSAEVKAAIAIAIAILLLLILAVLLFWFFRRRRRQHKPFSELHQSSAVSEMSPQFLNTLDAIDPVLDSYVAWLLQKRARKLTPKARSLASRRASSTYSRKAILSRHASSATVGRLKDPEMQKLSLARLASPVPPLPQWPAELPA